MTSCYGKVNVPARNLDQVSTTGATKLADGTCSLSGVFHGRALNRRCVHVLIQRPLEETQGLGE